MSRPWTMDLKRPRNRSISSCRSTCFVVCMGQSLSFSKNDLHFCFTFFSAEDVVSRACILSKQDNVPAILPNSQPDSQPLSFPKSKPCTCPSFFPSLVCITSDAKRKQSTSTRHDTREKEEGQDVVLFVFGKEAKVLDQQDVRFWKHRHEIVFYFFRGEEWFRTSYVPTFLSNEEERSATDGRSLCTFELTSFLPRILPKRASLPDQRKHLRTMLRIPSCVPCQAFDIARSARLLLRSYVA